ncbi:MAG TPA: VCBS repeat-containing protein, partial [Polyangium sp.]|nr:VCBS repeat-containing protein [Polyangium sp.]
SSSQCPSGRYGFPSFSHAYFGPVAFSTPAYIPSAADVDGDGRVDLIVDSGIVLNEGGGKFGRNSVYGQGARFAIAADVDRDGDMDIVAKSGNADSLIGVWRNLGNGVFAAEVDYSVGMGVRTRIVTDLNRDTYPDIVATTDDQVWILLNRGDGTYGAGTRYQVSNPNGWSNIIRSIVAGDFNEDGATDLAFRMPFANESITLLLNSGTGTFTVSTAGSMTTAWAESQFAKGDFNGDGHLDFALVQSNGGQVCIRYGTGMGSFAESELVDYWLIGSSQSDSIYIGGADLNNDGRDDLFGVAGDSVANSGGYVSVAVQASSGGFGPMVKYDAVTRAGGITAADFDGDGYKDVAFWDPGAMSVIPLRSNGLGDFDSYRQVPTVATSHTLGDVNGDGLADLVSIAKDTYAVDVWINGGGGTFTTSATYSTVGLTSSPMLADLDGNGSLDLAVAVNKFVTIFLNQGNGTFVHSSDYLSANDVVSLVLRDVNGDNKSDLLVGQRDKLDVRLNLGNGTFGSATSYAATGADGQILGMDVNNDGLGDIVTASCDAPLPARGIWLNQGNGTFVRGANFVMLGDNNQGSVWSSGDVNNDGRQDIVVMDHGLILGINNGDQTFTSTFAAVTNYMGECVVADVTRDNIADVVCSEVWSLYATGTGQDNEVNVFPGHGDGTFEPVQKYTGGYGARTRIADVDGDGVNDIVAAGRTEVAVMLNKCLP